MHIIEVGEYSSIDLTYLHMFKKGTNFLKNARMLWIIS